VSAYCGPATFVEIDHETGRIRVYNRQTGELLYELWVKPCARA